LGGVVDGGFVGDEVVDGVLIGRLLRPESRSVTCLEERCIRGFGTEILLFEDLQACGAAIMPPLSWNLSMAAIWWWGDFGKRVPVRSGRRGRRDCSRG